jgi:hypothetical protein
MRTERAFQVTIGFIVMLLWMAVLSNKPNVGIAKYIMIVVISIIAGIAVVVINKLDNRP